MQKRRKLFLTIDVARLTRKFLWIINIQNCLFFILEHILGTVEITAINAGRVILRVQNDKIVKGKTESDKRSKQDDW